MGSILNIGARALLADQAALQTIGNNIANVNTPGYSRQQVQLQTVAGQYTGSGYFGNGVDVQTVTRTYSSFLTQQAAAAQAVAAGDSAHLSSLNTLQNLFPTGTTDLGSLVSNLMNSFNSIVSAPSDASARTVTLSDASQVASTFQSTQTQIDQLVTGTRSQLQNDATAINSLAQQIATVNQSIAGAQGSGQPPNDLLDQRDQLIRQLNQYIQTTQIPASDGTVGVFVAGSQPLVLGTTVSPVSITNNQFNDPESAQLTITVAGSSRALDDSTLGGGEVSGLLKFTNSDLSDATTQLGRMAQAISQQMNTQQELGVDLNGNAGTALFSLANMPNGLASQSNTGTAVLSVSAQTNPSGAPSFQASNYQVNFTSATAGTITRLSDGTSTAFTLTAPANQIQIDGLNITLASGTPATGDQFLVQPFNAAAATINNALTSPTALAMASPVSASAGTSNLGTLALQSLTALSNPSPAAVTLTFTGANTYTRSDTGATVYTYTPGTAIAYSAAAPTTGWSLTLSGTPQNGDTYTIGPNSYPQLDATNAQSMANLANQALFNGSRLIDGYASVLADVGTRVQTAQTSSTTSQGIASSLETQRTSVSGVNLDEEAARMIQFQQAYQASSKMMSVAQSLFQSLIQDMNAA